MVSAPPRLSRLKVKEKGTRLNIFTVQGEPRETRGHLSRKGPLFSSAVLVLFPSRFTGFLLLALAPATAASCSSRQRKLRYGPAMKYFSFSSRGGTLCVSRKEVRRTVIISFALMHIRMGEVLFKGTSLINQNCCFDLRITSNFFRNNWFACSIHDIVFVISRI